MSEKNNPNFSYPDLRITDKDEIIKKAKQYLKDNSFIDLYFFIHDNMGYKDAPDSFVRDVAYKMVGTGSYEMVHTDHSQYFYLINKKWLFRHPIMYGAIVAVISAGLAVVVSIATRQDRSRLELLRETRQDSLIHNLTDSIKTLQKQIGDSANAIRHDSTFVRK